MGPSESDVFVNCPFDKEYEPILQAMLFCIVFLGKTPRIASETQNSADSRLAKIKELILASKYSIHDLSRNKSTTANEFARMNMPFELGFDFGCRAFAGSGYEQKNFLVLDSEEYQYQAALSDYSGCDIEVHKNNYQIAIRKVRNWLVNGAKISNAPAASRIESAYETDFQEWHYEKQLSQGFSDADIQDYPTSELLQSMVDWNAAGRPISFN